MSKKAKKTFPNSYNKVEAPVVFSDTKPNCAVVHIWDRLDSEFYHLKKIYTSWLFNHGQYKNIYQSDIIKKYCQYYHEYTEKDQFMSSNKNVLSIKRQNLSNSHSQDIIFKSFGILNGTSWGIRFTNKFLQRILEHTQNGAKNILAIMIYLANGNLPGPNYKDAFFRVKCLNFSRSFDYTSFFSMRIFINKNMIFNVGVQRIPIMDKNERITRYQFKPYMNFIDIINDNRVADLDQILNQQCIKLGDDVARGPQVVDDLNIIFPKGRDDRQYLFKIVKIGLAGESIVQRQQLTSQVITSFCAPEFQPLYLSNAESSSLIFDSQMNRWLNADIKMRIERRKFNLFQQTVNRQMLKKYVDFQSAKNLVDLLQKIPNFKIDLTEQQKNVIGQNGNVMVIGRSGTGKTTCAVMRLFAIEMLFKIRVSLNKKKYEQMLKDTRFNADDIDDTLGLHSLFVTASPVLTNQIQRYYKRLTNQIKEELDKKKKRIEEKKKLQEQQNKINQAQSQDNSVQILNESKNQEENVEEIVQIKQELPQISKQLSQEEVSKIQESKHMTQHFEGIQIQQHKDQNISDDEDQDFEELEQKVNRFASLNDLEEKDYPGFFTVRALLMMIDGTLKKPFFLRSQDNKIMGKQSKAAWHNEQKGVMMIENYFKKMQVQEEQTEQKIEEIIQQQLNYSDEQELQHQYQRQLRLRQQKNKQQFRNKILGKSKNQMSFEIDYDYFALHFWPQIKKKYYTDKNISAHMIWTEIYSTIKGSANSHLYPAGYLPQKVYLQKCQNMFLTLAQKQQIFQSFCQYQRWKSRIFGYDLIDVVNYINTQLKWSGYYGPSIHYLMIDEVQDLPHCVLYLLSRVAQQGVFFSGDTAQTIAKGVGFRFGDLKTMFDQKHFDSQIKLQKPSVLQLTVNFRSHNNILQLANSVVSIIEVLFPKTIDRLKKQRSNLHGPKPMLLADSDQELLFLVLCGQDLYKKQIQSTEGDLMKRPPLQFGCDQVIIVRDQESKKKIPSILQHALCLTIYQAKGLQFNDVILFNFFTESKCQDRWGIFKYINVLDEQIDKEQYLKGITKHPQGTKQENKQQDFGETQLLQTQDRGEKVIIKKIKPSSNISIKDINDYGQLCSQLKLLYTAITRPRNTLIIYDEDSSSRKVVEKFWQKISVTETITKQMLNTVKAKDISNQKQQVQIFQSLISKTDSSEWRNQGLKMFKRKYFEQAMKCFQRSGDKDLYLKAQANSLANEATKSIIQIEAQRGYLKDKTYNYANLSKSELTTVRNKLKKNQKISLEKFLKAGRFFQELQMSKQAGQCFFSGKNFALAKKSFQKAGMDKQVGQSLFMLQEYKQAAVYFDKSDDYVKTIECLDMINDWAGILKLINKYSNKIPEAQKQTLVRKYAALSLQQLVHNIQFENDDQKDVQMKKEAIQPLVIHEKNSDEQQDSDYEQDDQDDSDPEVQAEREYSKKMSAQLSKKASQQLEFIQQSKSIENNRKQSAMSEEQLLIKQQSNVSNQSQSQEEIKQIKEEKIKQQTIKALDQSNIQILQQSQDSSFFKLNNPSDESHSVNSSWVQLNEPDLQKVKSIADPSDEWLKSAFSEIENKSNTDYSVIDDTEKIAKNARIIKTKGNIFIQDSVMQKIIEIVSIVNVNIEDYLCKLKGNQALITKKKEGVQNVQIGEFEQIDPEFVFKILDTLQSFKIYKLCIFVCNRYHMPSKLGRYIASMMLKYSITAQQNLTITPSLLAPGPHRKGLLEKSILSSVALHSILQNINPVFLKIKVNDKNNELSLGSYFVTALVLQGLYKKIIFIVNIEQALNVLYNYIQSQTYRTMYITNYLKNENPDQFIFYCDKPTSEIAIQYSIFMAETLLWKKLYKVSNRQNNHPLVSAYFSKQHFFRSLQFKQQLPDYFSYNKALWKYVLHKQNLEQLIAQVKIFNKRITLLLNDQEKFDEIQIYDIVTFGLFLLNSQQLLTVYCSLSYYESVTLFNNFKKLYSFIETLESYNQHRRSILKAILSVYQARLINRKSKTMQIFGDSYIFIHRSSSVITDLVEYRRRKLIQFQEKIAKLNVDYKFQEQIFFCEQNLDLLMAPLAITLQHISQRMLKTLSQSLNQYGILLHNNEPQNHAIIQEDILNLEEKYIVSSFCKYEYEKLHKKYDRFKPKQKVTTSINVNKPAYANLSKQRKHAPKITKTLISHQVQDVEDSDQYISAIKNRKFGFLYENIFNHHPNLHPQLKNFLLEKYNGSQQKKINFCKFLYISDQNKLLRQFCRRMKGIMIYDALEFKLFNRVDMYAINLFEAMNDMSNIDQSYYIVDCLINLIVHLNSIENKVFKVQLPTSLLKFVKNIKFEQYIDPINRTENFRYQIVDNKAEGIFSSDYKNSADQSTQGIISLIKQCLVNILDLIENKSITNSFYIKEIFTAVVINVPLDQKMAQDIKCIIRKIHPKSKSILGRIEFLPASQISEENKKPCVLEDRDGISVHEIKFNNISNHNLNVDNSENDYNNYETVLGKRIRAIRTIQRTLKKIVKAKPTIQITPISKKRITHERYELNWVTVLHNVQPGFESTLFKITSDLTAELNSFYMQNSISSALDLHFMLMTMLRINQLRQQLIELGKNQQVQQIGQDQTIQKIRVQLNSIKNEIINWKADEKWRVKNTNLKKKKVFQLKWLSKTHQMKVIKKRAGLKKQTLLQEKKILTKLKK